MDELAGDRAYGKTRGATPILAFCLVMLGSAHAANGETSGAAPAAGAPSLGCVQAGAAGAGWTCGMEVRARGWRTGVERSARVDAHGRYVFPPVPVDVYRLYLVDAGGAARTLATVPVDPGTLEVALETGVGRRGSAWSVGASSMWFREQDGAPAGALAGEDGDGDGVRDDMATHLRHRFAAPRQLAAAMQFARVLQMLITQPASASAGAVERARACLNARFPAVRGSDTAALVAEEVEALAADTRRRRDALLSNRARNLGEADPDAPSCD